MRRALFTAFGAAAALLAAPCVPAVEPAPAARTAAAAPDAAMEVRRYEWVVLVRTESRSGDALSRAEIAAGRAGGAVLAELRTDWTEAYADHRLLVRTVSHDAINQVIQKVRGTAGVVGATAAPLPETPTWEGSPGFMESYQAQGDEPVSNSGRVLVHHDVPPIADKSELLEVADVVAGPGLPPIDSLGGFTFNISELLKRLKESAWRKREDNLRATALNILPPDGSPAPAFEPTPPR